VATGAAALFARDFRRLTRRAGGRVVLPGAAARSLVLREAPWEAWRDAFNALHHADPQAEARVAHALERAARAARRPLLAARFSLLEGRGLLRFGLPGEAADVLAHAGAALRAVGEHERAAQALVTAVDALAHAGRLREALRLAARARARVAGPKLVAWRDFLAINRANALRLIGDVATARRDYERAGARLAARGDVATATIARLNAGVARLEGGEPEAAHAVFAACVVAFEAQGRPDMAREARYNAACADLRRGRLGTAVRALEALAAEHDAQGPSRRGALCRMDLADALLSAGDPGSAEREAQRAVAGFHAARAPAEEVEALLLAAAAAGRTDRSRGARLARRALRRTLGLARPALADRCRLLAADLAPSPARPSALRALGRRARLSGQHEVAAQAVLLEAAGRLAAGRPDEALACLRGLGPARSQPLHLAVAVATLEAQAHAASGRRARALAALERACARLEPVALQLPGPWLRAAFLLEHLDPWLARVDLLLERGRPADRRAAEALLDGLAERRFRLQGRVPRGDARAARLRARLEALYDRLGRGGGATRGAGAEETQALLARARTLERALAEGWLRAERRDASTRPHEAREEAPLASDQAALHLWRRGDRVHALLRRGARASPGYDLGPLSVLARLLDRVGFHARRLRAGGGAQVAFAAALDALARWLLVPLAGAALPERLALIVDPALPDLPLEVLPWGQAPLASGTRLLRVPSLRARVPARTAGTGVSWLALGEPDLPGIAREPSTLAPEVERGEGLAATRAALEAALTRRARVHVSGHGFAAVEAPALGGVRLADGWFGAADLPESVHADVVVLAACRTGLVAGPGALAWGGLPAQLLAAGVRHCVWTADDVEDAATAALTARLHAGLDRGEDVSRAFGGALGALARERGHVATLLPFRLSGLLG
jgi:hypothetical protein